MPRIIRRAPWWQRLSPADWLLYIQEEWETIEWDAFWIAASWPCALTLNGLVIFLRLSHWFDDPPAKLPPVFPPNSSSYYQSFDPNRPPKVGRGWDLQFWRSFLEFVLVSLSFINTAYVFLRSKRYQLLQKELDEPPKSPNARIVEFEHDLPAWSFTMLGRLLYPIYRRYWPFRKGTVPRSRQIWELVIWDPPLFGLSIFCLFSPPQVLILHFMDSNNWRVLLPCSVLVGFQTWRVVETYRTHLKDKEIVFGQVLHEYNTSLVNPRLFVRKHDQAVGSDMGVGTDDGFLAGSEEESAYPLEDLNGHTNTSKWTRASPLATTVSSIGDRASPATPKRRLHEGIAASSKSPSFATPPTTNFSTPIFSSSTLSPARFSSEKSSITDTIDSPYKDQENVFQRRQRKSGRKVSTRW
ncbi:uncharacterized protein VTP21DRAFT_11264 [Calcarisporiella thermophila]|uniref:uncharacterized protein n=1 Tax=Calcarisporiella thermophila TaxID=911321 RepID=UPI0037442B19